VPQAGAPGGQAKSGQSPDKKRLFENLQKKRIVPNISSASKRPFGISKGMWKKELQAQVTGTYEKRRRTGKREPKEAEPSGLLGKRERA